MNERPGPAELGQRMVTGAASVIVLRMATRLRGVISTMILACLLVPADFGLIALAIVLAGVLTVLALALAGAAFSSVSVIDFQEHLQFDKDCVFLPGTKLSALLATVVLVVQGTPGVQLPWPVTVLGICVISGAVTCIGTSWLIWRLCGCPRGPESAVVDFLRHSRGKTERASGSALSDPS